MPSGTPGSASRTTAATPRATCGGSEPPLVSQSTTRSAPASAAAREAVERVAGVVAIAVEEVLGVVQHALALRDAEGDRVGDHRQVLLAARRARPSRRAAPRSCRRACRPARSTSASTRSALVVRGGDVAPARHAEGDDLARARALAPRAARTAPAPWGSTPGSRPRSGGRRARRARWTTRSFSSAVSDMPAAAHAVAQGGVVELYWLRRSRGGSAPAPTAAPDRATRGSARRARAGRRRSAFCTARVISPRLAGRRSRGRRSRAPARARPPCRSGRPRRPGRARRARCRARRPVAEVAGDLDHRLAVDAVEDRRGLRRRDDLAVADDEDVLARALADVAAGRRAGSPRRSRPCASRSSPGRC